MFWRHTFQMTLGRVAGERHSILSAARARTPPQSNRYFAFSVEFLETCQVPSCPSASDIPHASYKKTLQTQMMHLVELFSVPLTKPRLTPSFLGKTTHFVTFWERTMLHRRYCYLFFGFSWISHPSYVRWSSFLVRWDWGNYPVSWV
jgi:hypothetical protein